MPPRRRAELERGIGDLHAYFEQGRTEPARELPVSPDSGSAVPEQKLREMAGGQ
jgi:hypothetical protein